MRSIPYITAVIFGSLVAMRFLNGQLILESADTLKTKFHLKFFLWGSQERGGCVYYIARAMGIMSLPMII